MNYATLFKNKGSLKANVGIIGANGGFGYSFLAQVPLMEDSLSLRAICDLDANKSMELLKMLGYDSSRFWSNSFSLYYCFWNCYHRSTDFFWQQNYFW